MLAACFLHERQSFCLKSRLLKDSKCRGCSTWEQGRGVTLLALGQGAEMLGHSWSSWQSPCGVSQGWDIPQLWWLCLGRWQQLQGKQIMGFSWKSFCLFALLPWQKQSWWESGLAE